MVIFILVTTYFAAGNGNIYRFKKDGTFIRKVRLWWFRIPILLYSLIKNEKSYIIVSYADTGLVPFRL